MLERNLGYGSDGCCLQEAFMKTYMLMKSECLKK